MSQIFPPPFLDFQSLFKNSLNSIKSSIYSSIFNGIYPDSTVCKDNGKNFSDIGRWYENIWSLKNNSSTSDQLVKMCRDYQKECLLNTNWTFVNSWVKEENTTQTLSQFCPKQPSISTSTKTFAGMTSSVIPVTPNKDILTTIQDTNISIPSYVPEGLTVLNNHTTPSDFYTQSENYTSPFHPDNLPSIGGPGNDSVKYLAFLSLILPIIIITIIVVVVLIRKKDKNLGSKKLEHDRSCSTLGSNPSIQSFHSTPLKNLIHSSTAEKKSKKIKERGQMKGLPRQQSADSTSSTVYFVNLEEARQDRLVESEEVVIDEDKEKMMENWKQKLESLAEMLTKSDLNVEMNGNVGQEDC